MVSCFAALCVRSVGLSAACFAVFAFGMATSQVASAAEVSSMVAALRALPWDARAAVLQCLRSAELRVWLRIVAIMGPDEILFSALAVPAVEDVPGAIPLPGSTSPLSVRRRLRCKTCVCP